MLGELLRTQRALWHREAELAAGVPIVVRPGEEKQLGAWLQAVLRGGAQAVGCHAAALYLLDEIHQPPQAPLQLGLAPERLTDPLARSKGRRPISKRCSDTPSCWKTPGWVPNWNAREFPCAACVPVATGVHDPRHALGLLRRPDAISTTARRTSSKSSTGRLAADLEREMLLRESVQGTKFLKALATAKHPTRPASRHRAAVGRLGHHHSVWVRLGLAATGLPPLGVGAVLAVTYVEFVPRTGATERSCSETQATTNPPFGNAATVGVRWL